MLSPVETHGLNGRDRLSRLVAPASIFPEADLSSFDDNPSYGAVPSQDSYLELTRDEAELSRGLSAPELVYPSAKKQTSFAMILCFLD